MAKTLKLKGAKPTDKTEHERAVVIVSESIDTEIVPANLKAEIMQLRNRKRNVRDELANIIAQENEKTALLKRIKKDTGLDLTLEDDPNEPAIK